MTVTTTASLQAYLTRLYAARDAVLNNQSYRLGEMMVTRANAEWISSEIQRTEARLSCRSGSNSVSIVIQPR